MSLDKNTRKHIVLIVGAAALGTGAATVLAYAARFDKTAQHMSILRGQQWVEELLAGHPIRFKNEIGMSKGVFNKLLEVLERESGLKDSQYVSAQEQLAIFLHFVYQALSNCGLQECFQRSPDTISK
jgi:hypothetical protein